MDASAALGAIMLLLAVLTARLGHGGAPSRTAMCVAHLQSLGRAWALYAVDHAGVAPNNLTIPGTLQTINSKAYATWANNVLDWGQTAMNTNLSLMATGHLAPYLETGPGVFKCPSDSYVSPLQTRLGWSGRVRSYAMNGFVGAVDSFPGSQERGISPYYPNYRQFRQTTGIPNPAGTLLFLEEHPDSINDGVYLLNPLPASSWMDIPAAHHEGAANFAFTDGHVETRRWLTTTSVPPVRFMYSSPPLRGQATNDYRWVTERLTVPVSALALSRTSPDAAGLRLAWSQLQAPHVLQRTLDVEGGQWTPVTSRPVQGVGQWEVEVAPDEARGFFRLAPP